MAQKGKLKVEPGVDLSIEELEDRYPHLAEYHTSLGFKIGTLKQRNKVLTAQMERLKRGRQEDRSKGGYGDL